MSFEKRRDLSGQIYRQIRAAILDGRLRPGDVVPPSRELAQRLAVSRNTVSVAYDRLTAEGFVSGRVGAGTFVSDALEPQATGPPQTNGVTPAGVERAGGALRPREIWTTVQPPRAPDVEPEFDFRTGVPDARMFPYETWRRLMAGQLRASAVRNGMYGYAAGHSELRTAIARHIGVARAVTATSGDVIVTNGTQQALDLIGRVLIEPGRCVAVEEPGYEPPRRLFESLGARVVGIPVDAEGLVVDALPDHACLVYVTPSHQFPLGMPMSLARRMALLHWAHRHGAAIVEDDYDSEFRFAGRPIEPLHSLDRNGLVSYVGSFSKVMLPILRMGFVIAPPSLRGPLSAAKYLTDWHTALPTQVALAKFITEGALARHIRRMRHEYGARHELITATLTRDFGQWLTPIPSVAGLHLSALFHDDSPVDPADLQQAAAAEGVAIEILTQFAPPGRAPAGLVLGYGGIPIDRIDEGLRRLRRCLVSSV
ncbi:MAG TPA: PLP-dependent aminotransferase family protein [Micromonosporaceae bacterium]|nr:PLP-dependent aminotransferase family protein [Micromonosporaceae bacterium]